LETFTARHNRVLELAFAALYVLVMAVVSFKYHIMGGYGVETDFYIFVSQAKQIFEGEFPIDGARGPVYFVVLAVIGRIVGDFFRGGMIIGLLSAGFLLYFVFRLVGNLFRRDIALVVTVLTALNPTFVQHTYSCGTDMFFAALATGAVYYALRRWPPGRAQLVWSGILCALVYLTRFNGAFILVGLVLGLLLGGGAERGLGARVVRPLVLISVFLAAISPWGLYCLAEKGDFFYNTNYQNVAYAVYAEGSVGWDEFWLTRSSEFKSFGDVISSDPGSVALTLIKNVYVHLVKDMGTLLGWHLGVPALIGIGVVLLRRPGGTQGIYLLLNSLFFLILLAVFYNPRFSLFLVPFYLLLATLGLGELASLAGRKWKAARGMLSVVLALLVGGTLVQSFLFNKDVIARGPGEILSIARWYEKRVPVSERGGLIVARKPHIAYYLGLDFEWMPGAEDPEGLIRELRAMGADYLYFSYMEASRRPGLSDLLNPNSNYPGLRHLAHTKAPPAVLYAVE
jgi:4-amino-4-deoxy-L-arabinose transferase-like glycosyltransferase